MTDWQNFIAQDETNDAYPGWQWQEFHVWADQNLGPYVPTPGGILQTRGEFAVKAWQHPNSVDGVIARGWLKSWSLLDPDAFLIAHSTWQDTNEQLTRPLLTEQLENAVPALIIPDCFLVAINGLSGGQQVTSVVGVRKAGGTALAAAQAVQTAYKVTAGPLFQKAGQYALTDFRAMDLSSADGAIATVPDTATGSGSTAVNIATNAASALIKWNGSTRSKSSRGRLYHGPLMETSVQGDGRTLTSAAQTAFTTAYQNFINSLTTSGYPLVVLSRKNSTATLVTGVACESIIASQRRRIR